MQVGVNTLFLIPGKVGGTETYLRCTLIAMAKQHRDMKLILFTNRENDLVLRNDLSGYSNVSFQKLNFRAENRYARIIREQIQLPWHISRNHLDLVWSPGYTAPAYSACPQVLTIHDMQYKSHPEDLSFLARLTTDVLVQTASRCCRRIITMSQFAKREIETHVNVDSNKIDVVYHAADIKFSEPISNQKKRKVCRSLIGSLTPFILSVANSYPHKNLDTLVKAFGTITHRIPHQLVLVGRPRRGEAKLMEAISKLPDNNRIVRLHYLSLDKLRILYQTADIFVFPSLYEGFGLPVLEAMMAGTPVVTTSMASIPEVGGRHVMYTDSLRSHSFARRILEVLNWSTDYLVQWTNIARRWAKNFSWDRTAQETIDVFRKALI